MPSGSGAEIGPRAGEGAWLQGERTPSVSTLHEVFTGLDVAAFEASITAWAASEGRGMKVISLDGKGMRGLQGHELAGVRLVAAYADEAGLVLAQEGGKG